MTVLHPILQYLTHSSADAHPVLPIALSAFAEDTAQTTPNIDLQAQILNTAFLILLAGDDHPEFVQAKTVLKDAVDSPEWGTWATFYLTSAQRITAELEQCCQDNEPLQTAAQGVVDGLSAEPVDKDDIELIWSVLFPEGTAIWGHEDSAIQTLRDQRMVTIDQLNPHPIQNPAKQVLFTSNVLLTTPLESADLSNFDPEFRTQLAATANDPQLYWYDHPIPIGVPSDANEILYGLKHLNQAVAAEQKRHPDQTDPVTCVLSVSVTHKQLQTLGKQYLKQELAAHESLNHLNIFAFTETDTDAIIQQVLLPIVERCFPMDNAADLLSVFGVDGRYGRHYSFLKAIAVLWNVLISSDIQATFKIDLDQVFPQPELIEQTGKSAFEHLQTPLWGATGTTSTGDSIELGMIAGALVNQKDIHKGIFTPDVMFPAQSLQPDEYVFFSKLPQALSTEAEMMTRYQPDGLDGKTACLQRIHVTGGTNGILVNSLRKFQPFTPSFIARAEDQAYILSTLGTSETDTATSGTSRLGYAHASGLIMRHDKEGFAQEAISKAKVGKQIGDYLRILMFSAYAEALPASFDHIKATTNPFTGCFISQVPITVSLLRFAFKVGTLFNDGKIEEAMDFLHTGIPQLQDCLEFVQPQPTQGQNSALQQTYEQEKQGWTLFYRCLETLETALQTGENWAVDLKTAAQQIVSECRVD